MGRNRQGWTLRRRSQGGVWYVRFTVAGRTVERSTGTADREQATREAARIYASEIAREPPKQRRGRRGAAAPLEELLAAWLTSISTTHSEGTRETWTVYARAHFVPFFDAAHNLTPALTAEYMRQRLGKVLASTVRKELTALRSFLEWCSEMGVTTELVTVPSVPKRVAGTKHHERRRSAAIALSPEQTLAIIEALPEWSTSRKVERFPIRARFLVAYETSLRPSTLDRLEAPRHYRRGAASLHVTADIDKAHWERDVPLTPAARRALDAVAPEAGLIFGSHRYDEHIREAAIEALPPELAERFAGAHLRSARVTHLLERGANLPGVQHLAGHKLISTTARYVRPSERAAREALGLGSKLGAPRKNRG